MSIPKTYEEAIARGFKVVPPEIASARLAKAKAKLKDFSATLAGVAPQVNCATCKDDTPCDTVVDHGKVTIYLCKGGVCSPKDALEGDVDED
jgi:hypothetical protein